jgi:hypothetical protein
MKRRFRAGTYDGATPVKDARSRSSGSGLSESVHLDDEMLHVESLGHGPRGLQFDRMLLPVEEGIRLDGVAGMLLPYPDRKRGGIEPPAQKETVTQLAHTLSRVPCSAMTTVLILPRTVKSAVTRIHRGSSSETRSSRIWFAAASCEIWRSR